MVGCVDGDAVGCLVVGLPVGILDVGWFDGIYVGSLVVGDDDGIRLGNFDGLTVEGFDVLAVVRCIDGDVIGSLVMGWFVGVDSIVVEF